jgi:hypothetical protein
MAWTAAPLSAARQASADRELRSRGWSALVALDEHVLLGRASYDPRMEMRFGLVYRHPRLTRAQFGAHWLDVHAPLVLGGGPLFNRYVINLRARLGGVDDGGHPGWDGLVEQQFPDRKAWNEHDRHVLESKPTVLADLRSFIAEAEQYCCVDLVRYPRDSLPRSGGITRSSCLPGGDPPSGTRNRPGQLAGDSGGSVSSSGAHRLEGGAQPG